MDPMEQAEQEMLRRELENQRDLESAVGMDDFLARRDFSDRGKYAYTDEIVCCLMIMFLYRTGCKH